MATVKSLTDPNWVSIVPRIKLSNSELTKRIKDGEVKLTNSVWSIFELTDRMDKVAIKGSNLVLSYPYGWDKNVQVKLKDNPTWQQLAKAADKAIKLSGDRHHVFIENFRRRGCCPTEIELSTGS